jgi:hypothetical protein
MYDGHPVVVDDDADLEWRAPSGRPDVHRHVGIIGLEGLPVVAKCMDHVVVVDTVLAGARLDVNRP